jgi:DNA-binding CsgD family transcriptional regulator
MRLEDRALDLIERAYAAAQEPGSWREFLERLANATGAAAAALRYGEAGSSRSSLRCAAGTDAALVRAFDDGLFTENGVYRVLQTVLFEGPRAASSLILVRSRQEGPFPERAVELVGLLAPHVRRSLEIHRTIGGLRGEMEAAVEAFDRVPAGILLLDRRGRPVLVNRACRDIFASGDGLSLSGDGLGAAVPEDASALRRLLTESLERSSTRHRAGASATVPIARISRRRSYLVSAAPLPGGASADPEARVAVFITDPERRVRADGSLLKDLYRFTPAEAQIAAKLLQGESLEEAAIELDITMNTARTHLKHLFAKTETNRHRELVRVLLLACANLPPATSTGVH